MLGLGHYTVCGFYDSVSISMWIYISFIASRFIVKSKLADSWG